eukprot:jgi/Pico_ML_1/55444/g1127.t1
MTIPGLSLFYAGLVKKANVLSVLMHCFVITAMMTLMWVTFGYSMSFSTVGMEEGTVNLASMVSAATATLVWMIQDWIQDGKPTMLGAATGSIAGLASITPAAGFVGVPGALFIGLAGGIICRWFALTVKTKYAYDDSLDVFGVHAWVGVQTLCSVATVVYTLAATWLILKGIEKTIGLRVTDGDELVGLDAAEHGEVSYIE